MSRKLGPKVVAVALLAVLLLIPLSLIEHTISERSERREGVRRELVRTDVDEQVVAGPVLALPYTVSGPPRQLADGSMAPPLEGVQYILPATLEVDGRVDPDVRRRGLFSAMTYNSHLQMAGTFNVPARVGVELLPGETLQLGQPQLLVGVKDNRGLRSAPELTWNGQPVALLPGQSLRALGAGVHADLPPLPVGEGSLTFDLALDLRGNTSLKWVPLADSTRVHLTSTWPHPGFGGAGLPVARTITSKGFEAQWQSTAMASNIASAFAEVVSATSGDLKHLAQGVDLVQPVDAYQQAERSVKYGFLFVMLTFGAFALFEVLKELRIHPVQYGLVGIALALFFLLLLALSEHMAFSLSYAVAAAGCVALLGFYLSFVLRSRLRGLSFAGLLAVLYGSMYVLLAAEDFALLMGALLLFGLLALVMLLTRKVDWYALGGEPAHVPVRSTEAGPT